ncbi:MAG: hypothetical protein QXX35_04980 [Desulfurococcaceae archaeon]
MPIRYVCKKCGYVLWSFERVGQDYFGVPSPEDIIRIYGVCPRCKSDLSIPRLEDIVIDLRTKSLLETHVTADTSVIIKPVEREAVQET